MASFSLRDIMPTTNGPSAPALITSGILSELLFDCMPMGIAIIDRAYRILRYNPTWEDFAARYAPAEGAPLRPGVNYFDFLPGSESTVLPLYQRVLAGETIRQEGGAAGAEQRCFVLGCDVSAADRARGGGCTSERLSARHRAGAGRQTLEQPVAERTNELSTLLPIFQDVRSDSSMAQAFRRTVGEHLDSLFGYIRWMGLPLKVKGKSSAY